jgi:hypothetical protein
LPGIGTITAWNFCSDAAFANHEPFSANAYLPVRKRSHDADWLSVVADLGA